MTRPVQVTFRNMAVAPSLEHEVCARAAWLETFYDEIVGCRARSVSSSAPADGTAHSCAHRALGAG